MEFERFLWALSCLAIIVCLAKTNAQSVPCRTPVNKEGLCVAIQRCKNIYRMVNSRNPIAPAHLNYIRRAACTLPDVERSVCCTLNEVVPEQIKRSTTTPQPPPVVTDPRTSLLPYECGLSITDRIAWGNVTKVFDYPWMALLRYKRNGSTTDRCGGTLINKRYVLTAAHCLTTKHMQLDHVRLGEHTKNQQIDCNVHRYENGTEERDCADPTEDFQVESYVYHKDYNSPKNSNDIGLIRLAKDVVMNDHIHPICLPVTPELHSKQFENYILTGWGTTENQSLSDVLLEALLPAVDIAVCQRKLTQNRLYAQLSDKQMCAGGENMVDACKADSGGPLGYKSSYHGRTRFIQFGIVSFGASSCGHTSIPGVYCRVSSYIDWILDHLEP